MAEPQMTEAQRRAAARKAKILARGNAGLQRLAQTARGEEAEKLYGDEHSTSTPASSAPASRPQTPVTAASTVTNTTSHTAHTGSSESSAGNQKTPGWAPPATQSAARAGTSAQARRPAQGQTDQNPFAEGRGVGPGGGLGGGQPSPEEMQAQFEAMMRMLGGGGPGAGGSAGAGGTESVPDMSQLFASLLGGMPPPGLSGDGGPNLLADSGMATPNLGDPANNPFANMPAFPGMAGMPGMGMPGMAPPAQPSKAARYFPIIHAIAVIALVIFVTAWWEPTLNLVRWGGKTSVSNWATRWSSLAGRTGQFAVKRVEPMPVFYAFVTLEALLFATRVTLVQTPPSLHPLIANFVPLLPPHISRLIMTGSKYLGVASQVYADGCLFVFGLGCAIVVAEYLAN